jgi:hypothetical protein
MVYSMKKFKFLLLFLLPILANSQIRVYESNGYVQVSSQSNMPLRAIPKSLVDYEVNGNNIIIQSKQLGYTIQYPYDKILNALGASYGANVQAVLSALTTATNPSSSGGGGTLPAGSATESKQIDGNTSLNSIDTKLGTLSTSAQSATANTSLNSIDTKLGTLSKEVKQDTANARLNRQIVRLDTTINRIIQLLAKVTSLDTKTPTVGQKTMANSSPIVLSNDQSSIPVRLGATDYVQSVGNNTSTQLAAGATFVGAIESSLSYQQITVRVRCNQNYSVFVEQFSDAAGTISYGTSTYTRLANNTFNQPINVSGNYYQVRIQNTGAGATTNLFVETKAGIFPALTQPNNLGNMPIDNTSIGGVVTATGLGAANTGTQRMAVSNEGSNVSIPTLTIDIASAAIASSATTAAVTPVSGVSYISYLNITAVAASPTYQYNIEESLDNGTNWRVVYTSPTYTAIGQYYSPPLMLQGNRIRYVQTVGGTGNVTRSMNRVASNNNDFVKRTSGVSQPGTITAGGTAQTLSPVNLNRSSISIQNLSGAEIRVSVGSTASATNGYSLGKHDPTNGFTGGTFFMGSPNMVSTQFISIWGATTGQQFISMEQ